MRALALILGVLVLIGGAVWWHGRSSAVPVVSLIDTGTTPFIRAASADVHVDAGVVRFGGEVIDEETGAVMAGVRVRLFAHASDVELLKCGVCHARVLECEDASTAKQVMEAIRSGAIKPPVPIAETTTDAEGWFTFEAVAVGSVVVVSSPGKMSHSTLVDVGGDFIFELRSADASEMNITDELDTPLPNARVTLYEPLEGTLKTIAVDSSGHAEFNSTDSSAWVFVEADGAVPIGRDARQARFVLTTPRTLIVKTVYAGAPVDGAISFQMHRQLRTFPTKNGEARIDGLPYGSYWLTAKSGSLLAGSRDVKLTKPENEVVFDLRQSATLFVSLSAANGEPLDEASGKLSGSGSYEKTQGTNGSILIFGPVSEGEHELELTSPDMATLWRIIDLPPGETRLEIMLNPVPTITGKVVSADGKPLESVRVAASRNDEESGVSYSNQRGEFRIEVPYAGAFDVTGEATQLGTGQTTANAPGAPVVVRLEAHGVLEAKLFDPDGKQLPADFVLFAKEGGKDRKLEEPADGGWARLAGLPRGTYSLWKELPGVLPIRREVSITEGRTTRVTVQAERGVSITGRVIDERGAPVEGAMLSGSKGVDATTGPDGTFDISGLVKGPLEVWAVAPNGVESSHFSGEAPVRGIVLTIGAPLRVRGRVVDEKGAALPQCRVNGEQLRSNDGRFEVEAPQRAIKVSAEGYRAEILDDVKEDVGDVVLKREQIIEGEVVDAEGRGVSGVEVRLTVDSTSTSTDGRGHFKLLISAREQDVLALRGAWSGRAAAKSGASVRIVLQRGTHVVGRVLNAEGKGVPSSVRARSRDAMWPVRLETDAEGRFEGDVPQGACVFFARSHRLQRTVDVQGARMEVTLGDAPGSCGFVATADMPIQNLWLFPQAPPDDDLLSHARRTPGSIEVLMGVSRREIPITGVPCGSYVLVATLKGERSMVPVTLRNSTEKIAIPTPEDVAP